MPQRDPSLKYMHILIYKPVAHIGLGTLGLLNGDHDVVVTRLKSTLHEVVKTKS